MHYRFAGGEASERKGGSLTPLRHQAEDLFTYQCVIK